MSFNELNSVEHTIIQKLIYLRIACYGGHSGVNLNAEPDRVRVWEQAKYGGFTWLLAEFA